MNRHHYLSMARQSGLFIDNALELAQKLVSAEDVSRYAGQLEADIKKRLFRVRIANALLTPIGLVGTALAGVLCAYILVTLVGGALSLKMVSATILSCMAIFAWAVFDSSSQDTQISTLRALHPIAGTEACLEAAKMVERGYLEVLAWRDIALAERGQLSGFDVKIMECLDYSVEMAKRAALEAQQRSEREAKRKMKLDAACRKVHGVPATEV